MSTNRYFLKEGDFLRVGEFLSFILRQIFLPP